MKNIVIVGASGLIGSYVLKNLNNKNMKVIAVSLNMSDFKEKLDSKNIIYESYENLKNRVLVGESLDDYILLNLAYPRLDDKKMIESAIKFTYEITDDAKSLGINKYIYVSTQSVYDENRTVAATEDFVLKPKTFYGEGKVIIEKYLKEYSEKNNMEISILRLGSVVGPGMDKRITTRFVSSALKEKKLTVFDSGQMFSYIHLYDVIDVLVAYMEYISLNQGLGLLNVGTDEVYPLTTVANEVKEQLKVLNINIMVNVNKQEGEYKNNSINVDKLYSTLGWKPKFKLSEIIRDEIERQLKKS